MNRSIDNRVVKLEERRRNRGRLESDILQDFADYFPMYGDDPEWARIAAEYDRWEATLAAEGDENGWAKEAAAAGMTVELRGDFRWPYVLRRFQIEETLDGATARAKWPPRP